MPLTWTPQPGLSKAPRILLIALCLLVVSLALRFVPGFNDALSGPPNYMHAMAREFARGLVEGGHGTDPLFVARDEAQQCRKLPLTGNFNESAIALVIYYSESTRSLCIVSYAGQVSEDQDRIATVLDPRAMESYGAELAQPVKGVPISYLLKAFPPQLLALLDWHKPWPSGDDTLAVPRLEQGRSAAHQSSEDLNMDLRRARTEVGARHRRVNAVLNGAILLLAVTVVLSGAFSFGLYRKLRSYRAVCGLPLNLRTLLRGSVDMLAGEAAARYRQMDEARSAAEKSAHARQRRLADVRSRLEFLLEKAAGEQRRGQIQACLETGDLDEMEELAEQLLNLPGQKTPEERLNELLQSLSDLCSPEEYVDHRSRALDKLHQHGFRKARDFVVHTHQQLRDRIKEAEQLALENEEATDA